MTANVIFGRSDVFIQPHADKTCTYLLNTGYIRQFDVLHHVKLTFNCSYVLGEYLQFSRLSFMITIHEMEITLYSDKIEIQTLKFPPGILQRNE